MPGRALRTLAVIVVLWPGVQHVYVRAFDANPWRLAGWAMYATAAPLVDVAVTLELRSGPVRLEGRTLDPESARHLRQFRVWRRDLGSWVEPDGLAEQLWRREPSATGVRVDVERLALDGASGRLVCSRTAFDCPRDGRCQREPGGVCRSDLLRRRRAGGVGANDGRANDGKEW
jgi:hypothetical protein